MFNLYGKCLASFLDRGKLKLDKACDLHNNGCKRGQACIFRGAYSTVVMYSLVSLLVSSFITNNLCIRIYSYASMLDYTYTCMCDLALPPEFDCLECESVVEWNPLEAAKLFFEKLLLVMC